MVPHRPGPRGWQARRGRHPPGARPVASAFRRCRRATRCPRRPSRIDPAPRKDLQRLVIYRDDFVMALNKPHGLPVQGGPGIKHHVDGMLDALRFGSEDRPRLVHRLDRDTSGLLLLARTPGVAAKLAAAFRGRQVKKTYWAVVVGRPEPACRQDRPRPGPYRRPARRTLGAGSTWRCQGGHVCHHLRDAGRGRRAFCPAGHVAAAPAAPTSCAFTPPAWARPSWATANTALKKAMWTASTSSCICMRGLVVSPSGRRHFALGGGSAAAYARDVQGFGVCGACGGQAA